VIYCLSKDTVVYRYEIVPEKALNILHLSGHCLDL
jgi:hypothetical protein